MGVTQEEKESAVSVVEESFMHLFRENYSDVLSSNIAKIVVDRLLAYGISTHAIKNAFREETKADVDRANEASE